MRTSPSPTSRSAIFQPVDEVVEKQKRTPGSTRRHSRISWPATWTSPTETAWIQTKAEALACGSWESDSASRRPSAFSTGSG